MVYLLHHTLVIAVLLRCVDDALGRVDIHLGIVRHFYNSSDTIHLRNAMFSMKREMLTEEISALATFTLQKERLCPTRQAMEKLKTSPHAPARKQPRTRESIVLGMGFVQLLFR